MNDVRRLNQREVKIDKTENVEPSWLDFILFIFFLFGFYNISIDILSAFKRI